MTRSGAPPTVEPFNQSVELPTIVKHRGKIIKSSIRVGYINSYAYTTFPSFECQGQFKVRGTPAVVDLEVRDFSEI